MVAKASSKRDEILDRPTEEIIQIADDDSMDGEQYVDVGAEAASAEPRRGKGKFNLPLLLVGTVVSLLAVAALFGRTVQEADRDSQYIAQSSQLLMLSQRIAKDAREAALGEQSAFYSLKHSRDNFQTIIGALTNGSEALGIPATPPSVRPALTKVTKSWDRMRKNVDRILKHEPTMLAMSNHVVAVNQGVPLLLAQWDQVMQDGIKAHMSPQLIYLAARQGMLSERVNKDVNLFAAGGGDAAVAAAEFGRDIRVIASTQTQLLAQAPAAVRPDIQTAITTYNEISPHITSILNHAANLFVSQRASQSIFHESDPLLNQSKSLVQAYTGLAQAQKATRTLGYIMAAIALILASVYGFQMYSEERARAKESADQN
ncbi:MAG TPA: type IV pili methyl-accepting chemotaxis transducer N-terminal domain-containing protein, partial [Acidiferrobacteraceae bacterium]|nr:type IV pili methyl-accepting chemotaxis transducer N-terminal domain-containing protein [Acidiferrobacteraceae bacterium]